MTGSTQYETIEFERRGPIGLITLNRPKSLNAINEQMIEDLGKVLDAIEVDDEVRVVVLQGAGRAFCAGFDLKDEAEVVDHGVVDLVPGMQHDMKAIMRLWHFPKPTIAAAHGYAIAGGCELALACDLTVVSEGFKLGEPDLRFGAGIVVLLLPWLTGPKQAKELYLIGDDRVSAERCLEMGLINTVVPLAQLEEETVNWCREMLRHSPIALRCLKAAMNADCDGQAGLQELAGSATMLFYMTEEGQEGRNAYLEKRPPDFSKFTRNP